MNPTVNPAPKTASAREALRNFYCDLCDRGYARINEYEAHLSSYTHTHKKNLKEMKASQRNSSAAEGQRERERIREEKEMQRLMGAKGSSTTTTSDIKPINLAPKAGFKKIATTPAATTTSTGGGGGGWKKVGVGPEAKKSEAEMAWGNDGEDEYDPAYPTPA